MSVSRWLSDAASDHLRNQRLGAALDMWEAEDGPFTADELDAASRLLSCAVQRPASCELRMALVLDAGALIAIDRRDRVAGALLRVAQRQGVAVHTSASVLAQAWRDGARQASLARTLTGIDAIAIEQTSGRRVGELLADSGTSDIVDGHVALLGAADDTVLISDPADIQRLLDAHSVSATLARI